MLTKVILENYIPLLSSGITKVELNTKHMINLLIAPNGVGKSSVLRELNPWAAENGNYKAGRKYTEWHMNGKVYKLTSRTGVGNGHSFKIDNGPELNTGGTSTAFNELVRNHFGTIDAGLIRVLNGIKMIDRFSTMSPNRRKEIILQIYPNDTNYAMGVYNKLRQERNDIKGAIKNQIARHTAESNKLSVINGCGVEELERRVKEVDSELTKALLLRGRLESSKLDPELNTKLARFKLLVTKLTVNKLSGVQMSKDEYSNALETAENLLYSHQDKANVLKGAIAEHSGFLDGLDDLLQDPTAFTEQAKAISEDLVRTEANIARHNELLNNQPVFSEPDSPMEGLENVANSFRDLLSKVILVSDENLTSLAYKQYGNESDQLANELRHVKSNLSQAEHKLKHYQNAETVECPDCTSNFKIGFTAKDISNTQKLIINIRENIKRIEDRIKELTNLIENDAEWFGSMNQLLGFIRENGNVRVLHALIREYDIGKVPSNKLCNLLDVYLERHKLISYKETLLVEKALADNRVELVNKDNLLEVANHVKDLEKQLNRENGFINFYRRKVTLFTSELASINDYQKEVAELSILRQELFIAMDNKVNVELRDLVDDQVTELSATKNEHMTSIINAKSLTAVVESITVDIERMKRRLSTITVLMDGLCPNKGLIGKMMLDFINTLCGNINNVIRQVWNTTLYVKPCSNDNGDLNYKFPVVTGEADPTPDISDCSAGEADMIDWAFRFVMASYVGWPAPLVMDEVGVSFDEIKRGRFFNFIQEYTQSKGARQLFMVSHYFGQYGILKDPNVIAFKYDGLTLPGTPNKSTLVI